MASRRRSRFPRGSSTRRRAVGWEPGPEGILSPASSTSSLFGTTVVAIIDDITVVRTRGELLFQLLTSSVAQGGFQIGFGMCVVSQNAAGVGATAIPAPIADNQWDGWFVHWQGALKSLGPVTADNIVAVDRTLRVPIDSKAMRKLGETDTIVAMLETIEVGVSTMHAELRTRILVKAPA